jgi:hypothetical protein
MSEGGSANAPGGNVDSTMNIQKNTHILCAQLTFSYYEK